jgi:hypothetical protein
MASPIEACRALNFLLDSVSPGARDSGPQITDLAPEQSDALKMRLATYLLAADQPLGCARTLESISTPILRVEASALWWIAQARLAEHDPGCTWPPEGALGEEVSPLARAWLDASVHLERGESSENVRRRLEHIEEQLEQAQRSPSTAFEDEIVRALATLRLLEEHPPLSCIVQSYLAEHDYRAGDFDGSRLRYQAIADQTNGRWPALSLAALEAASAIRHLIDGPGKELASTTNRIRQQKQGDLARSPRVAKLAVIYRRLSSCAIPEDSDLVQELAVRLGSLQFADRLAGSLKEALGEPAAAGRALCRLGEQVAGFDLLLDTMQPQIVQEELRRLYRRFIADGTRVQLKQVWRQRRAVPGYEGTYGALARLITPLLHPGNEEDELDFGRLRQLVATGRAGLLVNTDQARSAAESLADRANVADGRFGRENCELLGEVTMDLSCAPLLRHDCSQYLTRYLNSWFEPDDLDVLWFLQMGEKIAERLSTLVEEHVEPNRLWPLHVRSNLLAFLGQVVWAVRRSGERADSLAAVTWRLCQIPESGSSPAETEIEQLWLGLTFGLLPRTKRAGALRRCREIVLAELEHAHASGHPHSGIGVPHRSMSLLDCMREALISGSRQQRDLANEVLITYSRDQYLSDRHRLGAFHSLEVVATKQPTRHRAYRKDWIALAIDAIYEPVRGEEAPLMFDTRPGALQVAALRLLAACGTTASRFQVARAHDQLERLLPLLHALEKADYLQAIGALMHKLPRQQRIGLMLAMLRETVQTEPVLVASAWAGLISGFGSLSGADKAEVERSLVQAVRQNKSGFPFRRIIMSHLADLANKGKLRLSRSPIAELIGICLDCPFGAVRYHTRRLQKHLKMVDGTG